MRGRPNPVDIRVGARVRQRRTLLGMSQEKLARGLGLTFQQVQKYERGTNRIGASRLFDLSRILNVSVSYFFDAEGPAAAMPVPGLAESAQATFGADTLSRRETLELVSAYYRIRNPQTRKRIFDLVRSLAESQDSD